MKRLLLIILCTGLLLYVISLVLFAKMQFDAGFAVMLGAAVLLIAAAFTGIRLWLRRRK